MAPAPIGVVGAVGDERGGVDLVLGDRLGERLQVALDVSPAALDRQPFCTTDPMLIGTGRRGRPGP